MRKFNAASKRSQFRQFIHNPPSIRRRLVFLNILVLVLTLSILGTTVYALFTYYLMAGLDTQLRIQGDRLQGVTHIWLNAGKPVNSNLFRQLVSIAQGDEFTSDSTYIKLIDVHSSQTIMRSPNLDQIRLPLNENDFQAALHGQSIITTYEDSRGRQVRILTLPIRDMAQHIILVAQVSQSLATVTRVRLILAIVLGLGSLLTTIFAYLISFWLITQELKPLRLLSGAMSSLGERALRTRLNTHQTTAEMRQLTQAFNTMTERLEKSFELQRAFVADVAHELRTPLTALHGLIDVLLLDPELTGERRGDVQQVRAELERLSRLVNNLLTAARAEVGMLPQLVGERTQLIELDALLIEVVRQVRFLNQPVNIKLGRLQQLSIFGNADLLKQLLLNLLDNALTYSRPDDSVQLEIFCAQEAPKSIPSGGDKECKEWSVIRVKDSGPGIDPTDLPHIFERHYRAKHLTSSSKLGSGLGLSIAHLIAEAHGGMLTVESELGQGTTFEVWFASCQSNVVSTTQPVSKASQD